MDFTKIYNSVSIILPEIAIAAFLVIILLVDLIWAKNKKAIPFVALAGTFVSLYFVLVQIDFNGFAFSKMVGSAENYGLVAIDAFGSFFKVLILVATISVILFSYSSDEIKKSVDRLGEYYVLIFGMVLGMFLMVSASDLILIYLSLELLSLSSYVLAGFTKLRDRNSEAALKYFIYGAISSGLMLFGISLFYGLTGSTNLYVINSLLQAPQINALTLIVATILVFVGIGYKISAAPFHFWTPDVYEGAPITITAFLSVASKAAGFALLIRFVKTTFLDSINPSGHWQMNGLFPWKELLAVISILTMTLGNFSALWQNNLKRMLAYSSIAHAGYLLLGLVVLSNQGLTAILIYLAIYAFMNLGAFFIVMLIANKIGSEDIEDYRGLGYSTPFLGVALGMFLISLIGLPPSAGFIGKLYLFIALIDSNMITLAVIAILNTVISLFYYIRVLKEMFLAKPSTKVEPFRVSVFNIIVVTILLAPIVIFGVYFTPVVDFAKNCVTIFGL
ncbi:MAG: NADH-quinone oxidoreductase subunit N [Ignavibacteriales bacterium]|nr:MAG: NADH-quinone oxidoreductase subunit N [Ignavibacteriales bacterium]